MAESHLETVILEYTVWWWKTIDHTGLNRYKSDGVGCLLR
jgi:hypothetical protein